MNKEPRRIGWIERPATAFFSCSARNYSEKKHKRLFVQVGHVRSKYFAVAYSVYMYVHALFLQRPVRVLRELHFSREHSARLAQAFYKRRTYLLYLKRRTLASARSTLIVCDSSIAALALFELPVSLFVMNKHRDFPGLFPRELNKCIPRIFLARIDAAPNRTKRIPYVTRPQGWIKFSAISLPGTLSNYRVQCVSARCFPCAEDADEMHEITRTGKPQSWQRREFSGCYLQTRIIYHIRSYVGIRKQPATIRVRFQIENDFVWIIEVPLRHDSTQLEMKC